MFDSHSKSKAKTAALYLFVPQIDYLIQRHLKSKLVAGFADDSDHVADLLAGLV